MTSPPPSNLREDAVYRKVKHAEADDFVRLGWIPTTIFHGTIHGQWSVMMMWLMCPCRPMPLPAAPELAHGKTHQQQAGAPA